MSSEITIVSKKKNYGKSELVNPFSSVWQGISPVTINLLPTPLGRQPSEYLKYTQDPQKVGRTKNVHVRSVHNSVEIFFMLEWGNDTPMIKSTEDSPFVDACGVIMPFKNDAPHTIMVTMGSEAYRVNVWYWRADEPEKPRNVWAEGLGTTVTSKKSYMFSKGVWNNNNWKVVVGRKMKLDEDAKESIQLVPGIKTLVSFAVWNGGNRERGGIKAFCPCKMDFTIEL